MSKPAAGTLIASNALTTDMVFAYLLNGSLATTVVGGQFITGLINSVGGAQPLSSNNANSGALNYDLTTDSLVFPGADFLGLPTGLPIETTGGVSAITVLIGFEGDGTLAYNTVWEMQTGADQEFDPYVNGHVLSAALSSSRGDYVPPTTSWFTAFNQLAVTGLAGGSLLSYINGVLADTRAADASIGIGVGPLIGSSFSPFKGKIQFFYAWTRVLSATELAALAADPYGPVFGVTATAQTITFASIPDHVSNDLPFTLVPTSTSGLTVSLAVVSGPATVAGDVVTLTGGAGTVVIQATQAGNGTYAAATPVNQLFEVDAAQRGNIAYDQIRASDRTGNGNQLLTYSPTPASATSPGTPGQVAFDAAGYWYFCYGVNQWGRIGPTGYGSAAASPPSW